MPQKGQERYLLAAQERNVPAISVWRNSCTIVDDVQMYQTMIHTESPTLLLSGAQNYFTYTMMTDQGNESCGPHEFKEQTVQIAHGRMCAATLPL